MENEIVVFYASESDVSGTYLAPGWYFEHQYTEVPEGSFKSRESAERAGIADFQASERLHHPIKVM